MEKSDLRNMILGWLLVILGASWYIVDSFPKIGDLTNLESLGIIVQGAIGLIVVLVGIILIIIARE